MRSRPPLPASGITGIRQQAHPGRPASADPGKPSGGWSPSTPPARREGDENRAPATLVDATHTRSRTRVRFPPSPLMQEGAKASELRPFAGLLVDNPLRSVANGSAQFAGHAGATRTQSVRSAAYAAYVERPNADPGGDAAPRHPGFTAAARRPAASAPVPSLRSRCRCRGRVPPRWPRSRRASTG